MITTISNTGVSSAASYLEERIQKVSRQLQKAEFGPESLIRGELADVWEECCVAGWDGYRALPVTWDSLILTERLLRALPLGSCRASIGAEPDGQITLEWGRTAQRCLSVSVSPDGELHYAALLGAEKTCGSVPFVDQVPDTIRNLIQKVC